VESLHLGEALQVVAGKVVRLPKFNRVWVSPPTKQESVNCTLGEKSLVPNLRLKLEVLSLQVFVGGQSKACKAFSADYGCSRSI